MHKVIPLNRRAQSEESSYRPMATDRLTRVGTHVHLRPVPESVFDNPKLANVDPAKVTYECPTCGLMAPLKVEIGRTGRTGYLRRRCTCEVREREREQMNTFAGLRREETTRKAMMNCYAWLGKGSEQRSLETKTFDNFFPDRQSDPSINFAYRELLKLASALTQQQQEQTNVLLTGVNGVGKTHLAAALINFLRDAEVPCLFATAPHFFDALYATAFEYRPAFLAKAVQARVLVLDELDKLYVKRVEAEEDAGSYQCGVLGELINGRYNKGLPTIFTTNEEHDLDRWLDRSSRSRLRENIMILPMSGVDMRSRIREFRR